MNRAFDTLSTKHKQQHFFKINGDFIEPIQKKDQDNDTIIGYTIPFKQKLFNLLSMPEGQIFEKKNLNILQGKNINSFISDGKLNLIYKNLNKNIKYLNKF